MPAWVPREPVKPAARQAPGEQARLEQARYAALAARFLEPRPVVLEYLEAFAADALADSGFVSLHWLAEAESARATAALLAGGLSRAARLEHDRRQPLQPRGAAPPLFLRDEPRPAWGLRVSLWFPWLWTRKDRLDSACEPELADLYDGPSLFFRLLRAGHGSPRRRHLQSNWNGFFSRLHPVPPAGR